MVPSRRRRAVTLRVAFDAGKLDFESIPADAVRFCDAGVTRYRAAVALVLMAAEHTLGREGTFEFRGWKHVLYLFPGEWPLSAADNVTSKDKSFAAQSEKVRGLLMEARPPLAAAQPMRRGHVAPFVLAAHVAIEIDDKARKYVLHRLTTAIGRAQASESVELLVKLTTLEHALRWPDIKHLPQPLTEADLVRLDKAESVRLVHVAALHAQAHRARRSTGGAEWDRSGAVVLAAARILHGQALPADLESAVDCLREGVDPTRDGDLRAALVLNTCIEAALFFRYADDYQASFRVLDRARSLREGIPGEVAHSHWAVTRWLEVYVSAAAFAYRPVELPRDWPTTLKAALQKAEKEGKEKAGQAAYRVGQTLLVHALFTRESALIASALAMVAEGAADVVQSPAGPVYLALAAGSAMERHALLDQVVDPDTALNHGHKRLYDVLRDTKGDALDWSDFCRRLAEPAMRGG